MAWPGVVVDDLGGVAVVDNDVGDVAAASTSMWVDASSSRWTERDGRWGFSRLVWGVFDDVGEVHVVDEVSTWPRVVVVVVVLLFTVMV